MSKKKKKKTWACGDCGTEYPYSVHHCVETGLDHAHLALRNEIPSHEGRLAAYPIYFSVARDLKICPPHPTLKPWRWESIPLLVQIHYEGRPST